MSGERYPVIDWEVYDGDTVKCRMRVVERLKFPTDIAAKILGVEIEVDEAEIVLKGKVKTNVRIAGVDTPEVRGPQKAAGEVVREVVRKWFEKHAVDGIRIVFQCRDKYAGRTVADFISGNELLSEYLLRRRVAKPYDGGTKEPWTKQGRRESSVNEPGDD